jgi:hypothetical protein
VAFEVPHEIGFHSETLPSETLFAGFYVVILRVKSDRA